MGIVGTFLIAVAVMAIVFYLKLRIDHKMLNTGKMINRQKNFMESAEEFTLQTVDPEQVTMAVSQIHYWEMGVT